MLAHLFKERRDGFYVDVGAYHPMKYSNTALLRENGWSGINIDISPHTIALFQKARPKDINVRAAVGDENGELEAYFFAEGAPASTNTIDYDQAVKWQRRFGADFVKERVPVRTLDSILESSGRAEPIDFLNIDVEGAEARVLRGFSIDRYQPRVVAIEIHAPDFESVLRHPTHETLARHGYRIVAYTLITAIFAREGGRSGSRTKAVAGPVPVAAPVLPVVDAAVPPPQAALLPERRVEPAGTGTRTVLVRQAPIAVGPVAIDGPGTDGRGAVLRPTIEPQPELSLYRLPNAMVRMGTGVVFESSGERLAFTTYLVRHPEELTPPARANRTPEPLVGADVVVAFNAGWRNYFHWLVQAGYAAFLVASCRENAHTKFVLPGLPEPYRALLPMLGIPPARVAYLHKNAVLSVPELLVTDAAYQDWTEPSPMLRAYAARIAWSIVREGKGPETPRKLYVSRADSRKRRISNEDAVSRYLAQHGYETVSMTGKSIAEQARLFMGADRIIAPHGAALSNLMFSPRGMRLDELTPSAYVNACYARLAQLFELDYALHSFPSEAVSDPHGVEWTVDIDRLATIVAS
ncbi:MAG: FkbM family methyltransferase [Alphaproteobacteria bacterium]|nr:FkbM family methyltransferase [Alphaproteobacteria bacterium]